MTDAIWNTRPDSLWAWVPLSQQFLAEMLQKHGCLQFSGCVRNYAFCLFDKFSEVSPVSCSTLKFLFVQICKTTCPFTKKGLILTLDVFFHKTICRYPTKFFVFRKKYEKSFIFCLTLRRKHSNIAVEIWIKFHIMEEIKCLWCLHLHNPTLKL